MNTILTAIRERRSCKNYKPDAVPAELIDQVIEAGLFAASAQGKQCPIVLAVTNKETRDKLSALNSKFLPAGRPDPFYGAPVVLTVLVPRDFGPGVCDGSLVIGNMMLAAHSLGLGSCWIHRAKESFDDAEGKAILDQLGVEGDWVGVGNCVLGYAADPLKPVIPRKEGRVVRCD